MQTGRKSTLPIRTANQSSTEPLVATPEQGLTLAPRGVPSGRHESYTVRSVCWSALGWMWGGSSTPSDPLDPVESPKVRSLSLEED